MRRDEAVAIAKLECARDRLRTELADLERNTVTGCYGRRLRCLTRRSRNWPPDG